MMVTAKVVEVKNYGMPEKAREAIFRELRSDFAEWMEAKEDLVWRPAIELAKEGNEFTARTLLADMDADDVEVLIAPEMALIKGEMNRGKPDHRKLMSSIRFPQPVNPDKVHAEFKDGMLSVRVEIAGASNLRVFRPRAA
jgi:HSP20 family molecular chaperone IbpA